MSTLLEQASLVMIPSGYKEDVVYSQIPTSGAGDLSFTRASNGTRVNSAGLVEVVPWNLLLNTDTFSSWNLEGGTLTSGFTAPDGSSTAYKYVQIPGGGLYSGNYGVTADVKFAQVWIKSVSGGSITVNLSDGSSFFGTLNVTGEWQLFTAPYTANSRIGLYLYGISNAQGIYVWHPQLNIGSTAKPYFPTTDRLNVPRLTYQNGGGGCPSLLLEKQSTNLLLYSEQFDNAAWAPIGSTITANNTTSPDGTQNADKITEDSSNGLHLFYNTSGVSAGAGTWTTSIFYKKGTRRYFSIKMQIGSSSYTQVFDADGLTTGGSSSNGLTSVSSTIVSMGNGWVRATLTGTDASGGGSGYGIFSLSNSLNPSFDPTNYNPTYQGSSSEYGYFYGAQLE